METRTFDYIVVGAGSAGAAVAYRLSESGKHSVLVLEAGRESHPWSRIPVGFAKLIQNPAANWLYSSEPDGGTGGRRIPVPRGKLLGGSSSINGMVFVRGQAQDSTSGRSSAIAAGAMTTCCRCFARWKAMKAMARKAIAARTAR